MDKKKIIKIVTNYLEPELIYLIGYGKNYKCTNIFHGDEIERIPYKVTHIDLLVLGSGANAGELKGRPMDYLIKQIQRELSQHLLNTVLILKRSQFNRSLKKGFLFALRTMKSGYLLFGEENFTLPKKDDTLYNNWKSYVEEDALHLFQLAGEYEKCALQYYSEKGKFQSLSILYFKEAFELYLKSALMGVLGIKIDIQLDTLQLMKIAQWVSLTLSEHLSYQQNRMILKLFETASSATLDRNFSIEPTTLQAVRDKVTHVRNIVLYLLTRSTKESSHEFDMYFKGTEPKW